MSDETMKDVSHTPPYGNGADRVWERGHEYEADAVEASPAEADETQTPADD
ncbi:hypothetical protein [Halorussus sp. AFM4]|uniref:hypothetical protein n=1 Tax=Halorussus sp. AFM4 TaxID=3421651 RepID=UPI003EBB1B05